MPYFTTLDISPDEVAKIGFDMLNKLYPEVGSANTHEDYGLNSKCSFPNPIRPWRSLDTKRKPLATTQQNRCSCRGWKSRISFTMRRTQSLRRNLVNGPTKCVSQTKQPRSSVLRDGQPSSYGSTKLERWERDGLFTHFLPLSLTHPLVLTPTRSLTYSLSPPPPPSTFTPPLPPPSRPSSLPHSVYTNSLDSVSLIHLRQLLCSPPPFQSSMLPSFAAFTIRLLSMSTQTENRGRPEASEKRKGEWEGEWTADHVPWRQDSLSLFRACWVLRGLGKWNDITQYEELGFS